MRRRVMPFQITANKQYNVMFTNSSDVLKEGMNKHGNDFI